jgi:hypothetical protein
MEKIDVQSSVFDTAPELDHIISYGIKISNKIVFKREKI